MQAMAGPASAWASTIDPTWIAERFAERTTTATEMVQRTRDHLLTSEPESLTNARRAAERHALQANTVDWQAFHRINMDSVTASLPAVTYRGSIHDDPGTWSTDSRTTFTAPSAGYYEVRSNGTGAPRVHQFRRNETMAFPGRVTVTRIESPPDEHPGPQPAPRVQMQTPSAASPTRQMLDGNIEYLEQRENNLPFVFNWNKRQWEIDGLPTPHPGDHTVYYRGYRLSFEYPTPHIYRITMTENRR